MWDHGALLVSVAKFLTMRELASLQATSRWLHESVQVNLAWDKIARQPTSLQGLVMDRASLGAAGRTLEGRELVRRGSVRCSVNVKLFLPELYGYSLVQPTEHDSEHSFPLALASQSTLPNAATVLQQVVGPEWIILSCALPSLRKPLISFHSPYKIFWLQANFRLCNCVRTQEKVVAHTEFLSLEAETFCEWTNEFKALQQPSELQQQMFQMDGFAAHAWHRRQNEEELSSRWVLPRSQVLQLDPVEEPRLHPEKNNVKVFYLISSSAKSSRVQVDQVAVCVSRGEWERLLQENLQFVTPC